jgi:hypothetical protein
VYVDASNNCNTAAFQLGQTGIGTTIPSRAWNIKVKQKENCTTNLIVIRRVFINNID